MWYATEEQDKENGGQAKREQNPKPSPRMTSYDVWLSLCVTQGITRVAFVRNSSDRLPREYGFTASACPGLRLKRGKLTTRANYTTFQINATGIRRAGQNLRHSYIATVDDDSPRAC